MTSFMTVGPEVSFVILFSLATPFLALASSLILYFAYLKNFTSLKRTFAAFFISAAINIPAAVFVAFALGYSPIPKILYSMFPSNLDSQFYIQILVYQMIFVILILAVSLIIEKVILSKMIHDNRVALKAAVGSALIKLVILSIIIGSIATVLLSTMYEKEAVESDAETICAEYYNDDMMTGEGTLYHSNCVASILRPDTPILTRDLIEPGADNLRGLAKVYTPEQVISFIDNLDYGIEDISAGHAGFYIFYNKDIEAKDQWDWKFLETASEVKEFIKDKENVELGYRQEGFYVFYSGVTTSKNWESKTFTDLDSFVKATDALNSDKLVTGAQSSESIIIFYQNSKEGSGKGWKLSKNPQETFDFINDPDRISKDIKVLATDITIGRTIQQFTDLIIVY